MHSTAAARICGEHTKTADENVGRDRVIASVLRIPADLPPRCYRMIRDMIPFGMGAAGAKEPPEAADRDGGVLLSLIFSVFFNRCWGCIINWIIFVRSLVIVFHFFARRERIASMGKRACTHVFV